MRSKKGGEEKKTMVALLVLIMATLDNYFSAERNCWTQNVYLAVTFSKIRLAIYMSGFAKTWLKKFQVHFNNLTSKLNGKQ